MREQEYIYVLYYDTLGMDNRDSNDAGKRIIIIIIKAWTLILLIILENIEVLCMYIGSISP